MITTILDHVGYYIWACVFYLHVFAWYDVEIVLVRKRNLSYSQVLVRKRNNSPSKLLFVQFWPIRMNISHQSQILGKHNAMSWFLQCSIVPYSSFFYCLGWARTPFVESHVSLVANSAVKLLQVSRLHVLQTLLATTGANKFDDFEVVVLVHQVNVWKNAQMQKLPCLNFKLELI